MCDGHEDDSASKPSMSAFMRNLRRPDIPVGRKLLLLIRNSTIKVVKLQDCCDHPGEPGC